jgi:hypothetical protein
VVDRLEAVRLKIDRAETHRQTLEAECRPWIEQHRADVVYEYDSDTTWHRFVVRTIDPAVAPLIWSIVLGELIHDLRSALDHTIWQLVLANNRKPNRSNQFPIFSNQPKPGDLGGYLRGVAPGAQSEIKKLQPYLRPNRTEPEPIEIIGSLSNTDKHQTLHAAIAVAGPMLEVSDIGFTTGPGPDPKAEFRWNQSLGAPIEGTELIAVRVTPPEGVKVELKPEAKPRFSAQVAFGEGAVPFGKLSDVIAEVRRIVALVEQFAG